ncbi:hypothetical protein ACFFQW_27535 [Umezawaea endophytica]|uniref:Uncharacterized protein n=1 Tax=Umezawaea endophytica TaxID=1654476 RepID=A0A9X3A362_9PSEU|nr:hypothetical protein [Umezawaea endophytica]MCS7479803.1 hypothetical protein [Umezawaea endophytica]
MSEYDFGPVEDDRRAFVQSTWGKAAALTRSVWSLFVDVVEVDGARRIGGISSGRVARPGVSIALAVRLLPAADRDRYLEEFRSEVYELVLRGSPRRTRIACALRILLGAPMLSYALRKPQRERAW